MHTMTSLRQQLKVNKTRSCSALSKQNAHKYQEYLEANNTAYTKDDDIARILNNQFGNVFSEDDGSSPDALGVI